MDGTLVSWAVFVLATGVPYLIGVATLILVFIRILIAVREYRLRGRELDQ